MDSSNIIAFPVSGPGGSRQHSLAGIQARRLRRRFIEGGKGQTDVFARLSVSVEKLTARLKHTFGDRSGKMTRVFGPSYIRVVQRFTAAGGRPPARLYRTPEAWLTIIEGFAAETQQSPETLLTEVLEDALFGQTGKAGSPAAVWLDELHALVDAMTMRLAREVDLPSLADQIAGSGLYLDDGIISVSEWPAETVGYGENQILPAHLLGLIPHVIGINYTPVADIGMPVSAGAAAALIPHDSVAPDIIGRAHSVSLQAGIRTGAAMVVHAETRQTTFALFEWQVCRITLTDEHADTLVSVASDAEPDQFVPRAGETAGDAEDAPDTAPVPENWISNSVRFHFPGGAGFERVARSVIVRPWVWTDSDETYFWRAGPDETDEYPVTAPVHTVAAAIESNLLYADDAHGSGTPKRLDRLLLSQIRQIDAAVTQFRSAHEARRRNHRDVLITEWTRGPSPEV